MNARETKLALARKKLKEHQDKKVTKKEEQLDTNFVTDLPVPTLCDDSLNNKSVVPKSNEILSKENSSQISSEVSEILIASKRNLELQVSEMQSKLLHLDTDYASSIKNQNILKQQVTNLECELKDINHKYMYAYQENRNKDKIIEDLTFLKTSLADENNNLQDQLELTKSILRSKESENVSLQNQLILVQNNLDTVQLQLQQLTNGTVAHGAQEHNNSQVVQNQELLQKISDLEQELAALRKGSEQVKLHYEHYVNELNEQLKTVNMKNEEFCVEIQRLSNRESSLIEQISDMEIRLQNYYSLKEKAEDQIRKIVDISELQTNYENSQKNLEDLRRNYENLFIEHEKCQEKIKELNEMKANESHNISMSKLNADITSDKIAVQKATEQNKKLKTDVQDLEEAFVKMSKDKLDLTEKLSAEKYLNRELTIKLADVEEKAKDMFVKLKAKDEEMIRLQSNFREIEKKYEEMAEQFIQNNNETTNNDEYKKSHEDNVDTVNTPLIEAEDEKKEDIPKIGAMQKLQERFLKIMDEVANLSDEKHRLEHIILQLQNETDTICEYVALYQQQRSLLKKRDEERSAQIKIFQAECDKLKKQLEELSGVLTRFMDDKELTSYFMVDFRQNDITRIKNLLSSLRNNSLIDDDKMNVDLKDFYPCSCCSGKLIDV